MPAKIFSATVIGLEATPVEVEADAFSGLPSFSIVGLPDTTVQEARERVRGAIKNSGVQFPSGKIVVNLAPANLRKEGSGFDLPIAIALLQAAQKLRLSFGFLNNFGEKIENPWEKILFLGELALDGKLRPVPGVLAVAQAAKKYGFQCLFLPAENAQEAALIHDLQIFPAHTLREILDHLSGEKFIQPQPPTKIEEILSKSNKENYLDMAYIVGQEHAKRALEIAAAGGHNVLLSGPPGTGKTLLAKAFPSILPEMSFEEMLEVTNIYSIAGLLPPNKPLIEQRPFRAPHHTASSASILGGGNSPRPGEITLAHRGVLFLDEIVEFHRDVLEGLREPLETKTITVSRVGGTATFPANFILIAARNPCPCGHAGDPKQPCTCSPTQILKYQKKISGPLLDRIDLVVEVPRVQIDKLTEGELGEPSDKIRERVIQARKTQKDRFESLRMPFLVNGEIGVSEIKKICPLTLECQNFLKQVVERMRLSHRVFHRTLKIARTIADLENSKEICLKHLSEALQYRPTSEN